MCVTNVYWIGHLDVICICVNSMEYAFAFRTTRTGAPRRERRRPSPVVAKEDRPREGPNRLCVTHARSNRKG